MSQLQVLDKTHETQNIQALIDASTNKTDTDGDGMGDSRDVTDVSSDVDNDGFLNARDLDSDGDGVMDGADTSPFSRSAANKTFHFDISTNGNPL